MAKISPISIKYMIYARFEAEGTVEKPDVIGALFGQTEGLLGNDLEMRELQKEGKIGRIEVSLELKDGKTVGIIEIPSSLDKTETTLIAAAVETIERIGPSDAKIQIEKIEDVRGNKRDYILERAKKLLVEIEDKMPKSREIAETIKLDAREQKLKEYGPEKLPVGDITQTEIIVVEGRADVINLLRNGVYNIIGMNGTILPQSIKELSYEKQITLFVDGDRGGRLIAKNVVDNAKIGYIAFAPDGKEVEELNGKEILVALRKKISVNEFLESVKETRKFQTQSNFRRENFEELSEKPVRATGKNLDFDNLSEEQKEKLKNFLNEISHTKSALFLDEHLNPIGRASIKSISSNMYKIRGFPNVILVDTLTKFVVNAVEETGIKNIVARNFTFSGDTDLNLISL